MRLMGAKMLKPTKLELENRVRQWIKKNRKENIRLEFKLKVDLSTIGAKAEFIRDVIALANSEGEIPRSEGHLVIGFRNGELFDIESERYDGAKFGQLLDSYISPHVSVSYEEFENGKRGRVGVLVVKPDVHVLYIAAKELRDEKGKLELLPGQSWGRKSDRKMALQGEAIQHRLSNITKQKIDAAISPLEERIIELQRAAGPALEVKKIRYEIEATREWPEIERHLERLVPYAREYEHHVKEEVLDALGAVTGRTRDEMPLQVLQGVDSVLAEIMFIGWGGLQRRSNKEISVEDQKVLKRVGHATYELTWDSCRYLRNLEMVRTCAHRYWALIRFAALNSLPSLQESLLEDIRYCQQICLEERNGAAFPEAYDLIEWQIKDALDLPQKPQRSETIERSLPRGSPLNYARSISMRKFSPLGTEE
ncbi:MAG: hypothetical protein DMG65_05945 [Candidatus Angelobacter sp. Gp1-AA117]|nr:MAG: hypothetical protein DMG65_05945 [Candidatus Angelobacter sp. Gp1-AA117]